MKTKNFQLEGTNKAPARMNAKPLSKRRSNGQKQAVRIDESQWLGSLWFVVLLPSVVLPLNVRSYLLILYPWPSSLPGIESALRIVISAADLLFKRITIRCGRRCCMFSYHLTWLDLAAASYNWCFNKVLRPPPNSSWWMVSSTARIRSQLCICRRLKILLKTLSFALRFLWLSIILFAFLFDAFATQSTSARSYPRPATHQYEYYPHSHHLVGEQKQKQQQQKQCLN